jgi:hypothetical protein
MVCQIMSETGLDIAVMDQAERGRSIAPMAGTG